MSHVLKAMLGTLAVLAALLAIPAAAQNTPDPLGEWTGVLATPQGELTLILHVARNDEGTLTAELESATQAPGQRIAMTEFAVADDVLTWRVAQIGASYEGQWNAEAEQWQGTFSQGMSLDLAFSRGLPEPLPVVEGLDGRWEGAMALNGANLRLIVNIATGEGGTIASLDSPDQMANGLPLSDLTREGQQVSFEFAPGQQSFAGTLDEAGSTLSGHWLMPAADPIPISFNRTRADISRAERNRPQEPQEPFPYLAQEVEFSNPHFADVHLAATLTLPEGEGPFPAAILISGSGPQDRDEQLLGHKPFAVIADHLTRNGIAVLRYDDRGVGGSTGDYAAATSADLATDANAAVDYLLTRAEIAPAAIGFVGHSEGGLIGPIAMASRDDIAFLVMLAGPGTTLDQLLLSQRRLVGAQMGMSEEQLNTAEPVMASVLNAIGSDADYDRAIEEARSLLTQEAMVALGAPAGTEPDVVLAQLGTPWFHYALRYDPAPNLARISVPILAINGALDLQVPAADNLGAIEAATSSNPDVTIMELEGLNHLFQTAQTGAVGEYADIEETFSPRALTIVSDWLRERFVKP